MSNRAQPAQLREQYARFPLPTLSRVEQEDPRRDLFASYNVDFGLVGQRALVAGARLWVAGASNHWAILIALQFGQARVVASDLSSDVLGIQERLARQLGVENIEFRHEDLLAAGYRDEFDYVSCCGPLHRLPSPAKGLSALARALRPGGLLELTAYDRINRRTAARLQGILRVLDPDGHRDARGRLELICEVLTHLSPRMLASDNPLRVWGRRLKQAGPAALDELAGCVSHPHDDLFDVTSLLSLLRGAGLRLRTWKNPRLFRAGSMLTSPSLAGRIDGLDPDRRAHICQLIAGQPLELFAERVDAPAVGEAPPLAERVVRGCAEKIVHYVRDGSLSRSVRRPRLRRMDPGFRLDGALRRPCVSAYGSFLLTPPVTADILELARRPVRIGEIVRHVGRRLRLGRAERERLLGLCDALCRPPIRVLATVQP